MKNVLVIMHTPPYLKEHASEQLDAALVHAAFGMNVSMLFQGDGVWQLMNKQNSRVIERKNLLSQLSALELYDINQLYVDEASLNERGIDQAQLGLEVEVVNQTQLQALFEQAQLVVRS